MSAANSNAALERADLGSAIEQVLVGGDLARLTSEQCVQYYNRVCASLGLNPLTKPFAYIVLNGKKVLYALKDATEQLRKINRVSVSISSREVTEGVYVVTARASMPDGRFDESIGAVSIATLKGEAMANALMKTETKAKRRVTLSICGLGMLDETEIETIPSAKKVADPAQVVVVRDVNELPARPVETIAEKTDRWVKILQSATTPKQLKSARADVANELKALGVPEGIDELRATLSIAYEKCKSEIENQGEVLP